MKPRVFSTFLILFLTISAYSQVPETYYQGSVARSGFIDQASYGPFNIGFNFNFFENTYTEFFVSSNGLVTFGAGSASATEQPIPTATVPNNFIAPFWDDLTVSTAGNILYTTIGAAPNRKLIIQFRNMGFYPSPAYMGTFAVILFETSGKIQAQYRLLVLKDNDRSLGSSATIGIENSTGTAGVQYAYHQAGAVNTNKAISFTPSGSTYLMDDDAIYEGVYLTTNVTLPEPAITTLLNPAEDAVTGTSQTFSWAESQYAASYSLKVSTSPTLSGAVSYDAGANLSHTVTGLNVNTTYYWGVFALNTTGLTWSEIKKFTTSDNPPLVAVPQTVFAQQGQDKTITLEYTGGDASAKTAVITSLPLSGELYQYSGGTRGDLITTVPANVTDPGRKVIYFASGSTGNGAGNFNFLVHDDTGDSSPVTITVNIIPAVVPNFLLVARSTTFVEIQFDQEMADPAGNEDQFTLTVNGTPMAITSVSLKPGDINTIMLTTASPLTGTETLLLSYTQGTVAGTSGEQIYPFTDQPVTLRAQTITFDEIPPKKLSDPPFTLAAVASSGLVITSYTSSNQTVATISGSTVTTHSLGVSNITARQAGNATYAPAKYVRTLVVGKEPQTIDFTAIPEKTYGDEDFALEAVASSGLPVTFSINNPSVATLTGNMVHITGGGTALVTASQAGDAAYNPAEDVVLTLTVNKAVLTLTADDKTRPYLDPNPELTWSISGFLFDDDDSDIDEMPVIGTSATQESPGGEYPIEFTEGEDNCYSFSFETAVLTITKIDQTITFSTYPSRLQVGDTYTLGATSTSGLTVLFESLDPSNATVSGDELTGVFKGTARIKAYHPGNESYTAAEAIALVDIHSTHRDILNLFTPNNDGINDLWELPEINNWGACDVKVYNRWGQLVYSMNNYNNSWDGSSDGKNLPEGAYYFIIKTENSGDIKGTVNIVR